MKIIKLQSLELENFKGVKELLINFEDSTQILGANGSGKTTVVDAFYWLFYGKDSNNRADFALKPRNEAGDEVNKLNSVVKAFVSVDGTTVELQKIYKEKWTKKRGELEATQDGHTTTYVLKGVEVKKKEYDAFIDGLVDEEVFKLITNPLFFNTNYKWEERRKKLIEIAGDVTESEVIESNNELSALRKILEDNTIDERTKIIKQQKSAIKKQIADVPLLITEASKAKIDTTGYKLDALNVDLGVLRAKKVKDEEQVFIARNGGAVADIINAKSKINSQIAELRVMHQSKVADQLASYVDNLNSLKADLQDKQSQLRDENYKIAELEKEIQREENSKETVKAEFARVKEQGAAAESETFDEHKTTCYACAQELPAEQTEEMRAIFNNDKAEKIKKAENGLAELKAEANRIVGAIEIHIKSKASIENSKLELVKSMDETNTLISSVEQDIAQIKADAPKFEDSPEFKELDKELAVLVEKEINIKATTEADENTAKERVTETESAINEVQLNINKFEANSKQDARIAELEEEHAALTEKYNELEKMSYLIEQFTKTKCDMLVDRINSKFKHVTFRLFENQINGGIKEVCETYYEGVPYNAGLNNAARINGGIDIINALTAHVKVQAPIFIDNRESVTDLIDTESQTISLVVSSENKTLKVGK